MEYNDMEDEEYDPLKDTGSTAYWMNEWEKEKELDLYKLIFLKYSSKNVIKEVDKYIEYSICNIEESKIGTKAEFFNKFENHKNIIKQILGKKYGQN